jgi:hypothetical protein
VSSPGSSTPTVDSLHVEPFRGGNRWLTVGGGVGVVLTAIIAILAIATGSQDAYYSYLTAFAYWAGIGFASVLLLMIFHATHARWMTILRRPVEAMAGAMIVFIILVIPIWIGMKQLYSWVDPVAAGFGKEALSKIAHKAPYLNVKFFIVRSILFILFSAFVAWRLYGLSLRQDKEGGTDLLARQRRFSAGMIPFVAIAITFAGFDWLMSLNPTWFSTVFGVYYFAGSFVSALSVLALITAHARGKDSVGTLVSVDHTHNIGKLMLAFTCFWTYIAFSQLLLIWIAGLPEETPFYITRFNPGWRAVGIFMIVGNFFVPFGALLSRSLKRDANKLGIVAFWILLVHLVDIFWLVMPTFTPEGVTVPAIGMSILAFAGIGLLTVAFGVWRLRGQYAVPVKDPYLADSLRYRQP